MISTPNPEDAKTLRRSGGFQKLAVSSALITATASWRLSVFYQRGAPTLLPYAHRIRYHHRARRRAPQQHNAIPPRRKRPHPQRVPGASTCTLIRGHDLQRVTPGRDHRVRRLWRAVGAARPAGVERAGTGRRDVE